MYSPRKQNAFLFYNHIATYGEQLVVVAKEGGMRHLCRKLFPSLKSLLVDKKISYEPITTPSLVVRPNKHGHVNTALWHSPDHLGSPRFISAFGHLS